MKKIQFRNLNEMLMAVGPKATVDFLIRLKQDQVAVNVALGSAEIEFLNRFTFIPDETYNAKVAEAKKLLEVLLPKGAGR
jgi:hypothetical protein